MPQDNSTNLSSQHFATTGGTRNLSNAEIFAQKARERAEHVLNLREPGLMRSDETRVPLKAKVISFVRNYHMYIMMACMMIIMSGSIGGTMGNKEDNKESATSNLRASGNHHEQLFGGGEEFGSFAPDEETSTSANIVEPTEFEEKKVYEEASTSAPEPAEIQEEEKIVSALTESVEEEEEEVIVEEEEEEDFAETETGTSTSTSTSTFAPTDDIEWIECEDDPDFLYDGIEGQNCEWVWQDPDARCEQGETYERCGMTCVPECNDGTFPPTSFGTSTFTSTWTSTSTDIIEDNVAIGLRS